MNPDRKARLRMVKLLKGGKKGPDGEHILGSSQTEALAALREIPIPPAGAGDADSGDRDRVDPVEYRRDRNRKKRERRNRR